MNGIYYFYEQKKKITMPPEYTRSHILKGRGIRSESLVMGQVSEFCWYKKLQ